MKKLIQKIKDAVSKLYSLLNDKSRVVLPVAINIVEGVKKAIDGNVDDVVATILKSAIKGGADDLIIDKVKGFIEEWIPRVLVSLHIANDIANIENKDEQLKAIFAAFKLAPDEVKNIAYHGLASLAIEKLSDGKITWSESVALSEYYFNVQK